jgi:hypothetical protein
MKNPLPPIVVTTRDAYHKANNRQFLVGMVAAWAFAAPGASILFGREWLLGLLLLAGAAIFLSYTFRPLKATYWPPGFE